MTPIARWHRIAGGACAVSLLLAPAAADAQLATSPGRWRLEPAVGIWHQEDNGSTRRQVGPLVSLQVGRQRGTYTRLTVAAAFQRIDDATEYTLFDVTGQSRTDIYDKEFVSVTAGAFRDLWQGGGAAVTLGFELGAGWNRYLFQRSTGDVLTGPFPQPPNESRDWTPVLLGAPSVGLRRALSSRIDLTGTGRILLAAGDLTPKSVPTLAAGVGYRF